MHFGEYELIRKLFNAYRFGPPSRFTATSAWPWVDHKVSRLPRTTSLALLRLAFASAPYLQVLNLAVQEQLVGSLCKRHAVTPLGAPTDCRHTVSGSLSSPCSGCFSPFPHGTHRYRYLARI